MAFPAEPVLCSQLHCQVILGKEWQQTCQLKGSVYLVVVDYFSRYIEVKQMTSTTAAKVIEALKSVFSR